MLKVWIRDSDTARFLTDADGLDTLYKGQWWDLMTFQWIRVRGGAETDIAGATNWSYHIGADDRAGDRFKVKVGFTDDGGNSETRTSDATAALSAVGAPTAAPTLGFDRNSGGTVRLRWSPVRGLVGTEGGRYEYQTKEGGGNYGDARSTGGTSVEVSVVVGTTYTFRVRGANSAGGGPWSNEVTLTALQTNSPPEFTLPANECNQRNTRIRVRRTCVSIPENTTAVTTVAANDPD
ncbi:MAG: fibronectin type III domain-containing protein, partial [Acidobacteria bacterium]|nr:fibronectin type III domain-containing protein [Acidobacteriota bacterium]